MHHSTKPLPHSRQIMSSRNSTVTFSVPTKGEASTDKAPKRMIDTRNLSEEDLEALRKQDPFLYYSILTVRNASEALQLQSSAADLATHRNTESTLSQRASCLLQQEEPSSSALVERKSCISFEYHTDLLLRNFIDDTELFGNGIIT